MIDTVNNNLNDDVNDDLADGKEPATKHDVTEGGVLGAVGGAIVGGLAGGPVGAIIGAIAGGAASAAAVDVVDKRDHDYNRTVAGTDTAYDTTTTTASPSAYDTTATTSPRDYDAPVTTTAPTAYATDTTPVNTAVYDRANTSTDIDNEAVIPVVEEELAVGKRQVQGGTARVHTTVTETPVEEQVSLHEEKVTIDRRPVDRMATDADLSDLGERTIEVTETREVPVVAKEARVVEEVVVGKTATDRTETIRDTVRRTDVVVDEVDETIDNADVRTTTR